MDDFSYPVDVSPDEAKGDLARLSKLADDLKAAQAEVARIESTLKAAQKRVQDLEEIQIPELMEGLGIESFRTSSGFEIEIAKNVHVSITNENKPAAFRWLDEHGHGGMIKRSVVVAFNRDQEDDAKALQDDLAKKFPGVRQDLNVHPSTLKAWATRRLEEGEELPESITVHVVKAAKVA